MKNSSKITSLLHILVLYGFIVSLYSTSDFTANITISKNISTNDASCFSFVHIDLFCHSGKTENFVSGNCKLPVSSLKDQLNVFLACTKYAELSHTNSYSKYIYYAENNIIRFQSSDIIFPFHYFW